MGNGPCMDGGKSVRVDVKCRALPPADGSEERQSE